MGHGIAGPNERAEESRGGRPCVRLHTSHGLGQSQLRQGRYRLAALQHVIKTLDSREILSLEFDGGVKQYIDRDLVLPGGGSDIKLTKEKQDRLKSVLLSLINSK